MDFVDEAVEIAKAVQVFFFVTILLEPTFPLSTQPLAGKVKEVG